MFASLGKALVNFFDGTLKGVILKSVALSLLLFVVLFIGFEFGLGRLPTLGAPWINQVLDALAPVLLVLAFFFLGAPVAAIFASFLLDDVAKKVEAKVYRAAPLATKPAWWSKLGSGVRIVLLILCVNLIFLPLDVELPGVSEAANVLANGWLLGREYFELAALRHLSRASADALRRRHGGIIFAGGTVLSVLTLVPLVNLFAPLFGAAFMVHMFRRYAQEEVTA